jgi:hypothetical protein
MPSIEYMLEVIDRLDGAGIIVEDPELIAEELEAMGFTYEGEEDAD